jgi:hypothetical protein
MDLTIKLPDGRQCPGLLIDAGKIRSVIYSPTIGPDTYTAACCRRVQLLRGMAPPLDHAPFIGGQRIPYAPMCLA